MKKQPQAGRPLRLPDDMAAFKRLAPQPSIPPDRSPEDLQRLLAVVALLTHVERIASSSMLTPEEEGNLRVLIYKVYRAFDLPKVEK